jgi:hypothetical protein
LANRLLDKKTQEDKEREREREEKNNFSFFKPAVRGGVPIFFESPEKLIPRKSIVEIPLQEIEFRGFSHNRSFVIRYGAYTVLLDECGTTDENIRLTILSLSGCQSISVSFLLLPPSKESNR